MVKVLYLHGFASSPESTKVLSVRELLAPEGIELEAPDLNVPSFERLDFEAMVQVAVRGAVGTSAIAGSSLGALVALAAVQRGVHLPLVLIAPALGIADRWLPELPPGDPIEVEHYAFGRKLPIHRAFFEQMSRLEVDRRPPPVPVTIVMGRRDESVPFERVERVWKAWGAPGRFIEIEDGDHRLTGAIGTIAEQIRAAASSDIVRKIP